MVLVYLGLASAALSQHDYAQPVSGTALSRHDYAQPARLRSAGATFLSQRDYAQPARLRSASTTTLSWLRLRSAGFDYAQLASTMLSWLRLRSASSTTFSQLDFAQLASTTLSQRDYAQPVRLRSAGTSGVAPAISQAEIQKVKAYSVAPKADETGAKRPHKPCDQENSIGLSEDYSSSANFLPPRAGKIY